MCDSPYSISNDPLLSRNIRKMAVKEEQSSMSVLLVPLSILHPFVRTSGPRLSKDAKLAGFTGMKLTVLLLSALFLFGLLGCLTV